MGKPSVLITLALLLTSQAFARDGSTYNTVYKRSASKKKKAEIARKLAALPPEEQEKLKKLADEAPFHQEFFVMGMKYDGNQRVFILKTRELYDDNKPRVCKLVFDPENRQPEYENYFHTMYLSGRPIDIGLKMTTREQFYSQYSVTEGGPWGSLNTIPASNLSYIVIGDQN